MGNKLNLKGNKNIAAIGNYTKGAVKNFEQNIVNQTNYLEKVEKELDKNNKIEG